MKVLFVCSQNMLRSPTAEKLFRGWPNVETRSVGTDIHINFRGDRPEVVPEDDDVFGWRITEDDVKWADIIIAMERRHGDIIRQRFRKFLNYQRQTIYVLGIQDIYERDDPVLKSLLEQRVGPLLEYSQPRPLTQPEIDSLRQDAISTSIEMNRLIRQKNEKNND